MLVRVAMPGTPQGAREYKIIKESKARKYKDLSHKDRNGEC